MADDDEEDLYDDEFDFVMMMTMRTKSMKSKRPTKSTKKIASPKLPTRTTPHDRDEDRDIDGDVDREPEIEPEESPLEDYGPPAPAANYVVHIYEYKEFKRTIDRPFTPEDAEAFASEYNRTAKPYGRFALTGKDDAKPKKELD